MMDFLQIMTAPFVACLILSGIHVYLGLHVVDRGVIFVDLALAQVAAFGATAGLLWGFELHSTEGYFVALAATLLGAALFSATRRRDPIVPQEAIIGIVYAVATAGSILVLSRAPEGGEELKAMLVGHVLFVEWGEIGTLLVLYTCIAALHWWARKPLLRISNDPEAAFKEGLHVRWWDFLFYASFGVVVTNAVQIAGVLLVFAFLIVPAVCAVMLVDTVTRRLVLGWVTAAATSMAGITASYYLDLPTGATVVCAFGALLVLCGIFSTAARFLTAGD
ncbi:MAG: iron chelate uptake ABC transporter family permease subunit [Candidatus Hydrogenedentes bacterium]|nr:iron chelate uptake ABC transporter family permease subunit [Candidatus Hydrogenedentota bacterium]